MTDRDHKIQNIADALLRLHLALQDAGLNKGAAAIALAEENDLHRLRMQVRASPTFWRDSFGSGDEVKIYGVRFVAYDTKPAHPVMLKAGEFMGVSIYIDGSIEGDIKVHRS